MRSAPTVTVGRTYFRRAPGPTLTLPFVAVSAPPRPQPVVVKSANEPFQHGAPLSMIAVESVLQDMEEGHTPTEEEVAGVLASAAELLTSERMQAIIEIDVDTSCGEQEINICGDLGGEVDKLWDIFEINGEPDEDNPYIFNGDLFEHGACELTTALFALKLLYPESVHILRRSGGSACPQSGSIHAAAVEHVTSLLPIGAMLNKEVLLLHADLFADDCRKAVSPQSSPTASRKPLPALLPYPSADPLDPVFLQQLKGLESTKDPTVATVRITPQGILLPDNGRFMVFRVTKMFKCVAYFSEEEEKEAKPERRAVERPSVAPSSRSSSHQSTPTWAQPRSSHPDGSQTARGSQGTSYSTASYMKPTYASGGASGSLSHRGAVPSRDPPAASVKEAPKLAYNAARHKEPSPSPDYGSKAASKVPSLRMPSKLEESYTSKVASSSKYKALSLHEASRAAQARSKVPTLNFGALASQERQQGQANPSGSASSIPPPNARGRTTAADEAAHKAAAKAAAQEAPSGSLSSRIERVAARYAEEYLRGPNSARGTAPADTKPPSSRIGGPPKASGPTSISGLRAPSTATKSSVSTSGYPTRGAPPARWR